MLAEQRTDADLAGDQDAHAIRTQPQHAEGVLIRLVIADVDGQHIAGVS